LSQRRTPLVWIITAVAGMGSFAGLAMAQSWSAAVNEFDSQTVTWSHDQGMAHPAIRNFFLNITDLGSGSLLNILGVGAVLVLLVRRDRWLALWLGLGLLAARPLNPWLKVQFERPRPAFAVELNHLDYSFPSGHAFGSALTYTALIVVVLRVWATRPTANEPGNPPDLESRKLVTLVRWILCIALVSLVVLIALSRVVLGVHYPSDVAAGTALGAGLVASWVVLSRISRTQ
jgi:undecaprenyl-diphosphatase